MLAWCCVFRLRPYGALYIWRAVILYFLRLTRHTVVCLGAEVDRRANQRIIRNRIHFDQLQTPAQRGHKYKDQGDADHGGVSFSPSPTRWTAVFIRGLELLRWSLLLFYRYSLPLANIWIPCTGAIHVTQWWRLIHPPGGSLHARRYQMLRIGPKITTVKKRRSKPDCVQL